MPSGSYAQAYVQCPFYKRDNGKKSIVCEGIIANSSLVLTYMKRTDYELQLSVYCCKNYKKCEVYQMLMNKYKEE